MVEVVTRFKGKIVPAPLHEEWLREHGCIVPGCRCEPIHLHHAKTKGAHGNRPENLVGLCFYHHHEVHLRGRHTFARMFGVDLLVCAGWLAFLSRCEGRL